MKKEVVSRNNKNDIDAQKNRVSGDQAHAEKLIALAKIGRPYGLNGAMHVFPYSNDAATLRRAKTVVIRGKPFDVKSFRAHGDAFVATLDGVTSPEQAQTFTNAEVFVSRDEFPPLPKGEFYWVDLVGLECTNGERSFGNIVEVIDSPAHPVLRVRSENAVDDTGDELIPFVDALIRSVDLAAKRVDTDWTGLQ
jgi:16S rRNA processing protein RimM